jgi:LysM repeat protein
VVVEKTKLAPTIKEVAEEPFVVPPPSTKAVEIGPRGVVYNVSKGEYHTVAKGQTFFRVALIYGMSVDELKELNGLENTTIEIGQKLKVRK